MGQKLEDDLEPILSNEFYDGKFYARVHYFHGFDHQKTVAIEVFAKDKETLLMIFTLHEQCLDPVKSLPSSLKKQYDLHDQENLLDFITSIQNNILDNFYNI